MKKLTKEHVENMLSYAKECSPELSELYLESSDRRLGKLVSLAKKGANGTVSIKTDFLNFSEMSQFLRGYIAKSNNTLRQP